MNKQYELVDNTDSLQNLIDNVRKAQKELSALQVAVDRTNLFSEIEYQD